MREQDNITESVNYAQWTMCKQISFGYPYSLSKTCFHQCFYIRFLSASFKELEKRCNLCSTATLHKITFLCCSIFLYSLLLCSLPPQRPSLFPPPTGPYFVGICSLPFSQWQTHSAFLSLSTPSLWLITPSLHCSKEAGANPLSKSLLPF